MTICRTMMTMKHSSSFVRVSVAEAKSHLSALLRTVGRQSVVIHNRGRDVARLVPSTESTNASVEESTPFVDFFGRLSAIRRRLKMRGVDFRPSKAVLRPVNPFEPEK